MALEEKTFHSPYARLRIVRQPGLQHYNSLGKPQGWAQKPVTYEFEQQGHRHGVLKLRVGQDNMQDGPPDPETHEPTWQDAIGFLRNHADYGAQHKLGGFIEEGREPGAVPAPNDVLDDIQEAAVEQDEARLKAILDEERASFAREIVIQQAERAIARVQKAKAKKPAGRKPAEAEA